jgi:hypothetical protein
VLSIVADVSISLYGRFGGKMSFLSFSTVMPEIHHKSLCGMLCAAMDDQCLLYVVVLNTSVKGFSINFPFVNLAAIRVLVICATY